MDDIIVILPGDKIKIHSRLKLRPERKGILLFGSLERRYPKAEIRNIAVRIPDNPDRGLLAPRKFGGELLAVRVPRWTPATRHHLLSPDCSLLETSIILGEVILSRLGSLDITFVNNLGAIQRHLRQVPDGKLVLEEKGILSPDQGLSVFCLISSSQRAFNSVLIVQGEYISKLSIRLRIPPTRKRISVKQDTIALCRDNEGNTYLGVVLVKFLALSLVVEFSGLMLSESIERLVRSRGEPCQDRVSPLSLNLERIERHPPLSGKNIPILVQETQFSFRRHNSGNG